MLTSSLCLYKPANGTGSELSLTVLLSVLNYHGEALIRLSSFSIFHFPLVYLIVFGYLVSLVCICREENPGAASFNVLFL